MVKCSDVHYELKMTELFLMLIFLPCNYRNYYRIHQELKIFFWRNVKGSVELGRERERDEREMHRQKETETEGQCFLFSISKLFLWIIAVFDSSSSIFSIFIQPSHSIRNRRPRPNGGLRVNDAFSLNSSNWLPLLKLQISEFLHFAMLNELEQQMANFFS